MVVIGATGILAPGRLRWLRALGWMVALAVLLVLAFNAVAGATLEVIAWAAGAAFATSGDVPAGHRLAAAVAGAIAILALYWIAVRTVERRRVPELDLRHLPLELLLGWALGGLLITVIIGALWLPGWVVIETRPVDAIALALRDSIRSGVVEEVLLRLVIFRLLWRMLGIWPALVGSALVFGLLHLGNPDSSLWAAFVLICGEGIGIGLYLITGRIWASIGMHAAWNFTQGWIFGAAVSGTSGFAGGPLTARPVPGVAELLSGGGFGPEASLAALVVSLVASVGLLVRAWVLGRLVPADEGAVTGRHSSA